MYVLVPDLSLLSAAAAESAYQTNRRIAASLRRSKEGARIANALVVSFGTGRYDDAFTVTNMSTFW
jgi:hypothetical protein